MNAADISCVAIDYCSSANNVCPTNSTCQSLSGGSTCICPTGYAFNNATLLCSDINECTANTSKCSSNSFCRNTPGSYVCDCNTGYKDQNTVVSQSPNCTDIDECKISSTLCSNASTCENIVGSYQCRCTATGNLAVGGLCTIATTNVPATTASTTILYVDNTGLILAIILPIIAVAILLLFAVAVCYFWFKM